MAFTDRGLTGIPLTRDNFAIPPPEMGILPFWFWNGEMDAKEMEWQLREYKAKGISGLFIHGRFGLKVPYVSDAWFEKVSFAVAKAKEIGIETWIYDEMNWPSGTAERKVPTQFPHLRQKYLELVALNVDGPLFTFLEATDNRYVNTGDSYPVAAIGCTEEEFQTRITGPIDLTQNLSFERVIPWEAPPGKWRLLYFLQKEIPYYIDTLNPESTKRFLELTHERYRQFVGADFGSGVPGFYTDEPAMHYYHVGIDNHVIPWTGQMFGIFRQKRGYDLRPWLPALYLDMGPRTARVRYDFWRTLTEQYAETYYGQIREWCDANKVLFTGHLLFEEWIRMHARCEGNLFKYLKKFHVIGVDHLYPKVGTEAEPAEHVSLKMASSAAHQFGSTRLLCESMGGSYWDCTLERMKWIANWEYVLGVNLFNNHGYHYSIEGERKRDWPPSQFYHHTWWKYYDRFTTYMARLSHLLSGGRHVAKLLILYPINSIWANYVPQKRTDEGNVTEFDFNYLTDTLLRLHYDFDYVDEDVLAEAAIGGGEIRIRDETHSVLILPPVTHLKSRTFALIEKFVRSGGTVIADTLLPVEFLDGRSSVAAKRVQRLFGADPLKVLSDFRQRAGSYTLVSRSVGRGKVLMLKGGGLYRGTAKRLLVKALRESVVPDVTVSDPDVFCLHRVKDGFDIYFFANTSLVAKEGVRITFERAGTPEIWNINTGETASLPLHRIEKGRLALALDFPPAEAKVIVIAGDGAGPSVVDSNLRLISFDGSTVIGSAAVPGKSIYAVIGKGKERLSARAKKPLRPIVLPRTWDFTIEGDNALLVDSLKMQVGEGGATESDAFLPETKDGTWLPVKPGAWEMQLPTERESADYPVSLWYRARVVADVVPDDLRILIDGFSGRAWRLFINGVEVTEGGSRSALDAEIKQIQVARYFRRGENLIAVHLTAVRRTDGILDPIKLVGRFGVDPKRLSLIPVPGTIRIGDITQQGFPFFSGTAVYRCEVRVPQSYAGGCVALEAECGDDVLDVVINDGSPVVLPWHPYRLDVSSMIRPGANRIQLKVTNTLINLLEGVRRPSGLSVAPRLVHEHLYTLAGKPTRKP